MSEEYEIMKPYNDMLNKSRMLNIEPIFYAVYNEENKALQITEFISHEIVLGKQYKRIIFSNKAIEDIRNSIHIKLSKKYKDSKCYHIIIKGSITILASSETLLNALYTEVISLNTKKLAIDAIEKLFKQIKNDEYTALFRLSLLKKLVKYTNTNFNNYKLKIVIENIDLITDEIVMDLVYSNEEIDKIMGYFEGILRELRNTII